jgi:hypothetical protein
MEPQTVTQIGIIATLAGVASLLAKMLWDQLQKRRAAADPDRESDAAAKTFGTALRELKDEVKTTKSAVHEVRGMMQGYSGDMKLLAYRVDQLEKKVETLR